MNGPEDKAAKNHAKRSAPRLAILFSAVVFPGAGQFIQKRWLTGLVFAALFAAGVVFLLITIFEPLIWNLRALVELAGTGKLVDLRPPPWGRIFAWFGFLLLVYAAGLLDTFLYNKRRC